MVKETDVGEIYERIQIRYDFEKGNMSQANLEDFFTAGRSDGVTTSNISLLSSEVEAKAIVDLEPEIEDLRSIAELNKVEREIAIPELLNNIAAQREVIIERNRQVSFFRVQFEEEFNVATTTDELLDILGEARDTAEDLGIETIGTEFRKFAGKSFDRNRDRLLFG